MRRGGREPDEDATQALPPSPLFPPQPYPVVGPSERPRRTGLIALFAALATLVLAGLAVGAFVIYDGQADKVSDLRDERSELRTRNADLSAKLGKSRAAAKTVSSRLAVANKNLRKARRENAAAKKAATAQYGAGFSAGTSSGYSAGSSDSYSSGYDTGYDIGYDAGYDWGWDRAYAYCSTVTSC